MKPFNWWPRRPRKRTEIKPRCPEEDVSLALGVRIDGYAEFAEQVEEMNRLIDVLATQLERLNGAARAAGPISVIHNHYNLCVNTDEAEKCRQ